MVDLIDLVMETAATEMWALATAVTIQATAHRDTRTTTLFATPALATVDQATVAELGTASEAIAITATADTAMAAERLATAIPTMADKPLPARPSAKTTAQCCVLK